MHELLDPLQETSTTEQPDRLSFESNDILDGLPIVEVGPANPLNPDRSLGFPHILYHGTKADTFELDTSLNHRNSGIGTGARSGRGLYTASETLSHQFGNGKIVEIIPYKANLIDLSSEDATQPLSAELKQEYLEEYDGHVLETIGRHFPGFDPEVIQAIMADFESTEVQASGSYVTKADTVLVVSKLAGNLEFGERQSVRKLINEIAAQVNTARMLRQLEGVSLLDIFAAHDQISGKNRICDDAAFNISPFVDFLIERGIDGAITKQKFRKGDELESGVVFWKLDRVGDKDTWEKRLKRS